MGRKFTHLHELRKNKHHNPKLQNHFNKYGDSDLQFIVLSGCDPADLLKQEQFYIDAYNPYFNICKTAGSQFGIKRSKDQIKAQIIRQKGRRCSEETRIKMRHPHEYKISEEERKKRSEKQKGNNYKTGKHLSEEAKKIISEKAKTRFRLQKESGNGRYSHKDKIVKPKRPRSIHRVYID
jgi:hypothetical protein